MNYMNYDFAPKADERKKARKRAIISCVVYGVACVALWSWVVAKGIEIFG